MTADPEIDLLVRLFRGLMAPHRVQPHWWGSIVTDGRCRDLWDANCAVVATTAPIPPLLEEIEAPLLPSLRATASPREHIVLLAPEPQAGLLQELTNRGDQIGWDVWMRHEGSPDELVPSLGRDVEEVTSYDDEFWTHQRRALTEFGVKDHAALQLEDVERRLIEAGLKRWVTIRVQGEMSAFGAVHRIDDGTVYIDNILTFPEVRGRGLATAIISHLVRDYGAEGQVLLLAEAERGPSALYERLGFREQGRIASSLRTVE